ncbi:putative BPI/LBP family protein At1g04970 [Rhododendron vialii]|uniref:putative BPI/LBP family protein At1g04970 n=1 Tax=Rhododendron vialii TaxID=182163 RepID=UPI00265F529B|nr:putative BPI/LBP family protein At1g04970 [Rhododendron vialii]
MIQSSHPFHLGLLSNFMAPSISYLFLILFLVPSYTHVQSTEEGFISIEILEKGIDFAKDLLINTGISSLTPLEVPQIEKSVRIPLIGTVHITLSNIILYRVDVNSSTVTSGDTGIALVVSGAKAYLSMDWSYHYRTWLIPKISDEGVALVEVKSMEVGLTVGLKNQQGTLELSLLACGCHVKDLSIKLDGGVSWLYQGVVDAFEKKIRSAIEDAISQKIEDVILQLDSKLQSLPKEIAINKIASLNVTFVNDLVFSNSSVGLEINGLFTARDEVAVSDNYEANLHASLSYLQALLSCGGPSKMGGISIHENVLNSISSVYFNADRMHWIIDKIPDLSLLNTAEWRVILPQLYKQYPNDDMDLNVSITSPPVIAVAQTDIDGELSSDVTIDVLDAGNRIPVACISFVITFSGYPEISRNSLAGRVELNDFTMSLKWSTIGNFHLHLLEPVIQTALRTVLLPYVNVLLWKGFPLPKLKGYTLHNAQFSFADSRIIVSTDVAPLSQGYLNPLGALLLD